MAQLLETRTYVCTDILLDEYNYLYGDKKTERVNFTFINTKFNTENTKTLINYRDALELARMRRNDKRYKNFEFIITKQHV